VATRFAAAGVAYPPRSVTLVAIKSAARLELWAESGDRWSFVRSYLVRATSGRLGPKLRQGDHQVPEGAYRLSALNPRSRYHLSLALDYPNAVDLAHAREDGRSLLGGDIMIHGDRVSDGCLPVGDAAIEELFSLVTRIGIENVEVIVSPSDLRRLDVRTASAQAGVRPPWLGELYAELARRLAAFPLPPGRDLPAPPDRHARRGAPTCKPFDATDCSRRCAMGDLASCARAGLLYADGRGVAPDADEAWSLLRRACDGGDALGCGALSQLLLSDDGLRRDAARAAALAQAACDGGDGHGCQHLAALCTDRLIYPASEGQCSTASVARLRERAVAQLAWRCTGWGAYDCATLAAIYTSGDVATALRLASASCQAGDPGGCDELGRVYEGEGDRARARTLYDRACASGYTRACERLAFAASSPAIDVR
jgi:TPR repeat protein